MGQAADQLTAAGAPPYGTVPPSAPAGQPAAEELRAQIERQRSELGRDLEVLGDRVSPGRMVERRRAAVRESARGIRDRVMGVADGASSRLGDTAGAVGDRVAGAPDAARQVAQGNPLAVGLVAFGAGAVLAAVIPPSEKERRLADKAAPALERAAEEAGSVAHEAVEDLKPAAQQAAEAVRASAHDAADSVKQEAQQAVDETKGAAHPERTTF